MKYILVKNKLAKGEDDIYTARPVRVTKRDFDYLVEEITGPGSILKDTETNAVIEAYWEGIREIIRSGEEYRDKYVSVNLHIAGNFMGTDARYDADQHMIKLNLTPSKRLKQSTRGIKPEFVNADFDYVTIMAVYDWASNTENDIITPLSAVEVKGANLKIYDHIPEAGIFFINTETAEEIKVKHIRTNVPGTLRIMIPDIPTGKYKLEVRNTNRDSTQLRVGASKCIFTVK